MEERINNIFLNLYNLTNDNNLRYIISAIKYYNHYAIIKSNLLITLDTKLLEIIVSNLCLYYFTKYGISIEYYYLYNYDIILTERGVNMKYIYNIEIPYGHREKYVEAIYEINKNVEGEGVVILYINNIPYNLQSFLYIETTNNDMINIINKYKLKQLSYGKNMVEYIQQMRDKSWNSLSFFNQMNKEEINLIMKNNYQILSISDLEKKGYKIPIDNRKIFISYSHKDKDTVIPFIEKLKNIGISIWIDQIELDFGENITEKIQEAMKNCEMALLFLSENTKEALYQKYELTTIFNDIINNSKKFIPIKLDNVDPNDILYGLRNYLYVDFSNQEDVNKLISKLIYDSNNYNK